MSDGILTTAQLGAGFYIHRSESVQFVNIRVSHDTRSTLRNHLPGQETTYTNPFRARTYLSAIVVGARCQWVTSACGSEHITSILCSLLGNKFSRTCGLRRL
jgi:hypothetical protein